MTHRLLLPIATSTLALLLAATTVAAQDYDSDHIPPLRCESQFNKTQQCPIEGRMRLARQLSVTRCVEDQNWGQSSSPTNVDAAIGRDAAGIVTGMTTASAWSASPMSRRTRNAASACVMRCAWSSRSR